MDVLASRFILYPADYQESLRFYRDVLGLAVFREYPGGTVFFAGGGLIELAGHGPSAPTGADRPFAIFLQVRDAYAAERDLRASGVEIERETKQEPWGLHELRIRDPQGTLLILAHVPQDHPQRRAAPLPQRP